MNLEADRADKTTRKAGALVVYIFGTGDGTEVKIGKTNGRVSARRSAHENNNGHHEPLLLLAAVRASQDSDERAIHHRFSRYRSRPRSREWFHACPEIRSWIRSLQGQHFVATNLTDADDASSLPLIPSSYWLPDMSTILVDSQLAFEVAVSPSDPWADLQPDAVMEGDFYTHPDVTAAARNAMGAIDLDPASCTMANQKVQARHFYGAKEDGLTKEWHGRVWLNPPFGNWDAWAQKAVDEFRVGHSSQLCALASSRSTTSHAFHPIAKHAAAVWIARGRYGFWGPNAGSPDEGHFVFYFGGALAAFRDAFEPMGAVYLRDAVPS